MAEGASPAKPRSANAWWQALEEAWKVKLGFEYALSTDYPAKLQTAIAGDQLGDLTQITRLPNLPQVLEKRFVDLTPYLAGDAIEEYPGLASLPTAAWTQIGSVNGKIWGIPQPRPPAGIVLNYAASAFEGIGRSVELSDGQDFVDLFTALTNAKSNRWAIGQAPTDWLLPLVLEMMEAPNGWANDNGRFISVYESDRMPDALDQVAKMWKAGCIHPDAFSGSGWLAKWHGGILGMYSQNFPGWSAAAVQYPHEDFHVIRLPKWDGGGMAAKQLGLPGYPDPVGLAHTTDEKRIRELLRIVDYIASPFGTQEYILVTDGVKGHDYTFNGSDPVHTESWGAEHVTPSYAGSQQFVNLYVADQAKLVTDQHDYLSTVLPTGVSDASWGFYSQTDSTKGSAARKDLRLAQGDIIQGRKKVADWAGLVSTWKKSVGDLIRAEYEAAAAGK
jgi:putative aldouronate transport system substrate-binding protein